MSSDNGIVVRKLKNGKWISQMYFASSDEWPDIKIDTPQYDTMEKAVEAWRGEYTEYGFTFIFEPTDVPGTFPAQIKQFEKGN